MIITKLLFLENWSPRADHFIRALCILIQLRKSKARVDEDNALGSSKVWAFMFKSDLKMILLRPLLLLPFPRNNGTYRGNSNSERKVDFVGSL